MTGCQSQDRRRVNGYALGCLPTQCCVLRPGSGRQTGLRAEWLRQWCWLAAGRSGVQLMALRRGIPAAAPELGGAASLREGREVLRRSGPLPHLTHVSRRSPFPTTAHRRAPQRACGHARASDQARCQTLKRPQGRHRRTGPNGAERAGSTRYKGSPETDTRGRQTERAKEPAPQPDTWQFSCAAGGKRSGSRKARKKHKKPSTAGSAILQPKSCGQRRLCGAHALPQRPHSSRCPHAAEAKPAEPDQPDCHPSQQREHAEACAPKRHAP